MPLVIDASVALAWCFADEASSLADKALHHVVEEGGLVPGLWHLELANILSRAERQGRIDQKGTDRFFARLDQLGLTTDTATGRAKVIELCRTKKLTAYDAAYLELCLRRQARLATLDADLQRAAGELHVGLLK